MTYQYLPTHFVANDNLCAFLLANGCREITQHTGPDADPVGLRLFERYLPHLSQQLSIAVNQVENDIELYCDIWLGRGYPILSTAALVYLLSTQDPTPAQQALFFALVEELSPR